MTEKEWEAEVEKNYWRFLILRTIDKNEEMDFLDIQEILVEERSAKDIPTILQHILELINEQSVVIEQKNYRFKLTQRGKTVYVKVLQRCGYLPIDEKF